MIWTRKAEADFSQRSCRDFGKRSVLMIIFYFKNSKTKQNTDQIQAVLLLQILKSNTTQSLVDWNWLLIQYFQREKTLPLGEK